MALRSRIFIGNNRIKEKQHEDYKIFSKWIEPQYQSHHLDGHVDYNLHRFDINLFPEHLKRICLEQNQKLVKFYTENLSDLQYGVWAFIDGHKNNQSLNHLKRKVPMWKAEIPDDTIVYGVNWDKKYLITNVEATACGFYIPQKELSKLVLL